MHRGHDMGLLDGKVALITGAARGQGAEEARLFAAEGAQVIVCDIIEDEGRALCDEIGPAALFQRLDVSRPEGWQKVMRVVSDRFGRLHVLVNNAAICKPTPFSAEGLDAFEAQYRVNQLGPWLGICAAVPLMQGQSGSIINIASASGIKAYIGHSGYSATKYAVRGLTKVAALDLAPHGIRVNAVLPGFVETPMIAEILSRNSAQQQIARLPARRAGAPRDIANLVCFPASDLSSYCTGADFVCDGGLLTGQIAAQEG